MFYIVTHDYIGPNPDTNENIDASTIEIQTKPPRKNLSQEPCSNGWCGSSNDFSVNAHGEYETLEKAREAVKEIFGEVRDEVEESGKSFESHGWPTEDEDGNPIILEVYKKGALKPLSTEQTADLIHMTLIEKINSDTTDEAIKQLAQECTREIQEQTNSEPQDIEELMKEFRREISKAERESNNSSPR